MSAFEFIDDLRDREISGCLITTPVDKSLDNGMSVKILHYKSASRRVCWTMMLNIQFTE